MLKTRLLAMAVALSLFGTVANVSAAGMDNSSLLGTFKMSFQEATFEKSTTVSSVNIENLAGLATLVFDGVGSCTWSVTEDEYDVNITNPTSVFPFDYQDSGSCTYNVSVTGLVAVDFGDGEIENWQLSTDGQVLLGGDSSVETFVASTIYENWQDVGIKLGTNMTNASLNGVYDVRGTGFEFWEENGWISDGYWSDKFDLSFDGAGGCSLTNYQGNEYELGISSQNNGVTTWPETMPTTACTYSVASSGETTLTLPGDTITLWVSGNGSMFTMTGADSYPDDDGGPGMGYEVQQTVGIKKGSGMTLSSLNGTFFLVAQGGGYYVETSPIGTSYSKYIYEENVVASFNGMGSCTIAYAGDDYDAPFGDSGMVLSFPDSMPETPCTYTMASDGAFVMTITGGETFSARLSADGQLINSGDWGTFVETNGDVTGTDYDSDHSVGIKVLGFELTFEASALSDFDADGTSDVLFQNSDDGRLLLWGMNNLARETVKFASSIANTWSVVGKGDFNNDGTADVLYHKDAGDIAIAEFSNLNRSALEFPGGIGTVWVVKGVGDFDGDGTDDILFRRSTDGVTLIWGIVNSARAKVSFPGGLADSWEVAGIGDFNGDGTDDILYQDNSDGRLLIWEMNNLGRASVKFAASIANTWTVVGVADFNADGTDDVLYRKDAGDVAIAEFSNLNRSALKFPGGIGTVWTVQDTGDYNGDGTADILYRRTTDSVTAVWGITNSARTRVFFPGGLAAQWVVK